MNAAPSPSTCVCSVQREMVIAQTAAREELDGVWKGLTGFEGGCEDEEVFEEVFEGVVKEVWRVGFVGGFDGGFRVAREVDDGGLIKEL